MTSTPPARSTESKEAGEKTLIKKTIKPRIAQEKTDIALTSSRMRTLFDDVGRRFFAFSLLMRLPSFMIALATLLIMAHRTGEVSLGAYAAGLIALCSAATHQTYRALSSCFGYRWVLFITATLNIPAVAFLMIQTMSFNEDGELSSVILLLVAAACAGLTTAPLGTMMRSFWAVRFADPSQRSLLVSSTAFESILDVLAMPVAAVIVGVVSLLGGIQSSLFAVIVINVLGMMLVLWSPHTTALLVSHRPDFSHSVLTRYSGRQLGWIPMLGTACLGIALGSTQSALVIRSVQIDALESVGLYLGIMGASGTLVCLVLMVRLTRLATWEGWLSSAVILLLSSMLLSIPQSRWALVTVLVLFGCVLGGALMCIDTLITRLSMRHNIDLAHSTTQSTYIGGLALGFVWAVVFGGMTNASAAMLVPLIAATGFLILSHIFGFRWRQLYEERLRPLESEEY